jgi:hypothetical protein
MMLGVVVNDLLQGQLSRSYIVYIIVLLSQSLYPLNDLFQFLQFEIDRDI